MTFHSVYGSFETEEEVLAAHDKYETLHAFIPRRDKFITPFCVECGDTEEGLMHNNTVRNIEPLLDLEACAYTCQCKPGMHEEN